MSRQTCDTLILIIDDDAAFRANLEDLLTVHNYKTLTACDGIEAIALYTQYQNDISVVLLDLMMTSLNSQTIILILKLMNPQVAIITMSQLSSYTFDASHSKISMSECLLKPFNTQELLKALQTICSSQTR